MDISDADFRRLTVFIRQQYGIDLSHKRQLISGRLSHSIKTLGYSGFTPFVDHLLKEKNPKDVELVINKLTTNYTYFMREREHFDFQAAGIVSGKLYRPRFALSRASCEISVARTRVSHFPASGPR